MVTSFVFEYAFELYVAGDAPTSRTAVRNLKALCEDRLPGRYELTVIDVLVDPAAAERAKILATPTLLKLRPSPTTRVIGDLSLSANVAAGLGLDGADSLRGDRDHDLGSTSGGS